LKNSFAVFPAVKFSFSAAVPAAKGCFYGTHSAFVHKNQSPVIFLPYGVHVMAHKLVKVVKIRVA
jgi:hypothetical protein